MLSGLQNPEEAKEAIILLLLLFIFFRGNDPIFIS